MRVNLTLPSPRPLETKLLGVWMESLASGDFYQAPPGHQVFPGAEEGIASKAFQPTARWIDATAPLLQCKPGHSLLPASVSGKLSLVGLSLILSAGPFLTILPPCSVTLSPWLSLPSFPLSLSIYTDCLAGVCPCTSRETPSALLPLTLPALRKLRTKEWHQKPSSSFLAAAATQLSDMASPPQCPPKVYKTSPP